MSLPSISLSRLSTTLAGVALAIGLSACGGSGNSRSSTQANDRQWQPRSSESESVATTATPGAERNLEQTPLERSWELPLADGLHRAWTDPALPDYLLVQTNSGQIQAIKALTGHTQWFSESMPDLIEIPASGYHFQEEIGDEIYVDDRLYVISGGWLFAIDAAYGQIIWRTQLGFEPSTSPAAEGVGANLRVYLGDWEGRLRTMGYDEERKRAFEAWSWNLHAVPLAKPATHDGKAYIADTEGILHSFGPNREKLWEYDARNSITGAPKIRQQELYFGSQDHVFHVIDRLSGEARGKLFVTAPISRAPFYYNSEPDRMYIWTDATNSAPAGLRAIYAKADIIPYTDTAKAKAPKKVIRMAEEWFAPEVTEVVGSSPVHLYAIQAGSTLVKAINRKTGAIDWTWDAAKTRSGDTGVRIIPNVDQAGKNFTIFTVDDAGTIIAYRRFNQKNAD